MLVMTIAIWLGIIAGIFNAMTKISKTREGVLPPAKEYPNIVSYVLRGQDE